MESSSAQLNFPDPQPTSFKKKMLREVFCTQKACFIHISWMYTLVLIEACQSTDT